MKRGSKHIVLSLLLATGLVCGIYAVPQLFTPSISQGMRSWRLSESLTMIDSSGTWINNELAHNYFNPNNPDLVDSTVCSYYDYSSGWFPGNVDCFSYNISQEYITEIVSNLVMMTETIPQQRSIYEYDNDNHLVSAKLQISGLDRDWFDIKRAYITYNNGYLEQIVIYDSTLVEFPPTYIKSEFDFGTSGRITLQKEYISEDSLNWSFYYKTSYLYHANDTTTGTSLVEIISKKFPLYLHFDRPMGIGMLVEKVGEMWMYQYWRNDTQDTYAYDNFNRLMIHQNNVNTMMGQWLNNELYTFTYDADGNLESKLMQFWNEDPPEWLDNKMIYYTWEQTTANEDNTIPVNTALQMNVYPNPFNEHFEVKVRSKSNEPVQIAIYNIKGQKVYQNRFSANSDITLNSNTFSNKLQSTGVYFLKAIQGKNNSCRKIIRLK